MATLCPRCLAYALKIIDRPTKKKLDQLREIRNVAAHAQVSVSFDAPEIINAVYAMYPQNFSKSMKDVGSKFVPIGFKIVFIVVWVRIAMAPSFKRALDDVLIQMLKKMFEAARDDASFEEVWAWAKEYIQGE